MNTLQFYAQAGCPEQTIETLAWLSSCSEKLLELLESYKHLQPDGKPFSTETIEKISQLQGLQESLSNHEREHDYHAKMIERCKYEIDCIEKGIKIIEAKEEFLEDAEPI